MSDRPNVVVVLTDQQRWDTTGVHGNPLDPTPEFDALAREGTLVREALTPQPVCGPARSSLQTGLYPTALGTFRNGIPLPGEVPTLAKQFADAGYATGYIGKWHLASADPVPPDERGGYAHWLGSNTLEFTSDAYQTVMYDEDERPVRLVGYRSDAIVDAAIRFVADHHAHPFLLFVSLLEPHHQNATDSYPAPKGYRERYAGRWVPPDLATHGGAAHRHLGGYLGQIKRVDEGFGRLRDALESLALTDSTIVAWTADHGNHFRTRNAEYKRSAHDVSIRVPLALSGPGFTGGGVIRHPVSTVDLVPTLLDAAGLPVPDGTHGRSFLPLVGGGTDPGRPASVFVQISESEVGRAVRTARWKYAVTAPGADGWTTAASTHYVESALYDLDNDPYELDNLVGLTSHREVADRLRGELLAWLARVGEKEPAIDPAPEREPGQRRADPEVRAFDLADALFAHHIPPPRTPTDT